MNTQAWKKKNDEHFSFRPEIDSGVCMLSSGCREPEWCIEFDWSLSVMCVALGVKSSSGEGLD